MADDASAEFAPADLLRPLIDAAVDGIIMIDASGRIELCNTAAAVMFGYRQVDIVGASVTKLMPERYASHHADYIQRYLDGGPARIIGRGRKVEGLRSDGREFPIQLSVGEYRDGGVLRFVGLVRDLTQEETEHARIRELEEQVTHLAKQYAVAEMGAALAHELNQPLTAIDLFLTSAKRLQASDPVKASTLFDDACAEAHRAGQIVKKLRQIAERADQVRAFFRLRPVVEDAVNLCCLSDKGAEPEVVIEVDDDLMALGDEVQIRQVLVNLIRNALEATADQTNRRIVVQAEMKGFLDIEVADNGPGLPLGSEDLLFEPFSSSKSGGMGIGLSISRTIAQNHGGELVYLDEKALEKELGGARFRLRLPLDAQNAGLDLKSTDRRR